MVTLSWFDRGARAVSKRWPDAPSGYVCPLCLAFFPAERSGELTREHAPPRSSRGSVVTLTCLRCNNNAGIFLDPEMAKREAGLDFLRGTMEAPVLVDLQLGGITQRVTIQAQGGSIKIVGLSEPKANRRGTSAAIQSELVRLADEDAWDGFRFSVTSINDYSPQRARVGWLRSAYLVAFAALGYRYIAREVMDPIRRRIANPASTDLEYFSITNPRAKPTQRQILRIDLTRELDSVVVQMGRHVVFLPGFRAGQNLYDHLASFAKQGQYLKFELHGDVLPWPGQMELALDWL
jgi:hypothetical protein